MKFYDSQFEAEGHAGLLARNLAVEIFGDADNDQRFQVSRVGETLKIMAYAGTHDRTVSLQVALIVVCEPAPLDSRRRWIVYGDSISP